VDAEVSTFSVTGLERPVDVLVDEWGIPHLYAESEDDLFFAQGFNAARDRLFQMDLWRRRGLGRLAEVLGPAYVERDRAARLFLYRGDMEREWAAYGPDARRIVTRFTEGINAYVDWLADHPEAMPPEFGMLGYRPARWEPEDVVRIRSHGIAHNVRHEVARAATVAAVGWERDLVRQRLRPHREPHHAEGMDFRLPAEVLRVYDLATQPLVLVEDTRPPLGVPLAVPPVDVRAGEGSNNWAVAPSRTATGRPILASDPHRAFSTPSFRYIAHLSAPGLDVVGAGEPVLPGICLGHNGRVAFGFTIVPVDVEDLYVYQLHPDDPTRYRYGDRWEAMRVLTEAVAVRGEEPREVELAFTRHGPVLHVDADRGLAYALRSMWFEPGTAPYLGSLRYLRADDGGQFRAALREWRGPGENHVYADVTGQIGWQAAGWVPRRPGWDGLLPVPGDGRYEWDGFHTADDFPGVVDPPRGFVATANQYILPEEFPADRKLCFEWPDDARYRRIVQRLRSSEKHTLVDSMRLQTDVRSLAAEELLRLLREVTRRGGVDGTVEAAHADRTVAAAMAVLDSWNAELAADSAAAALFEVWVSRHLTPALIHALVPAGLLPPHADIDRAGLREGLREPTRWFGPDGEERRDRILLDTLRSAYQEVESLLGKDPSTWAWGDLHKNHQRHPLGFLDPALDVGPLPVGGSASTVNAAPYIRTDFAQTIGASFRMVLDVGAWDNSVVINTPGQSGDPRSPHYRDLVELWRRGEYVPLLYSRAAVERHTTTRLRLEPRGATSNQPSGGQPR